MIDSSFLAKIPVFERLDASDLETLRSLWAPRTFGPGEIIFHVGDKGSSMFIIEGGIVDINVPDELYKEQVNVSVLHEGDFFGEISLLDGLPRTATAQARVETRLLVMDREDFILFLTQRPQVAIAMLNVVGGRLRETNKLVTSLATRNVNVEHEEQLSIGDRVADKLAEFGGSWPFIILFMSLLVGWMILNSIQMWFKPFDEFPFIFLNLLLSCLAALQAPVIMMSQNRASKKDRLAAELDYKVNLKSELLLQQLHAKMDDMRAEELHYLHDTLRRDINHLNERFDEFMNKRQDGSQ